ncbi:radical SAM protein [Desulfosporosinus sp. FKA]|uniref:coproporphyrinogen-III oxidase family protein n=1 Tax=Desulfosporosinus sp. FKA TaxID=1969834 RepID=UPI000B4A0366|nr:radical SAM protein [Desulfosporosinus sp. FKA]
MSLITTATRMWLTRSFEPFTFKNDYDQTLPFQETTQLGLYVHIPFCRSICSFCPYCKVIYDPAVCDEYIDYLIKEIHMVGSLNATKKVVSSLYFGGGSPALALNRLEKVISAIKDHFIITEGIGIELHPDNIDIETLEHLKKIGITKVSIGIQSFQPLQLEILGRQKTDFTKLFQALKRVTFETISMDFIFALPNQTITDLKSDIEKAFDHGANHIAIYPFIDFTFANSKISSINKNAKRKLMDEITLYCLAKGYRRDSIWTFSNDDNAKYSSMTRDNFLGFGCSATTLLKDQFKVNTFSIQEYQKRIEQGKLPTSLTIRFTKRQRMLYYLFWTAYSTKIDAREFELFFGEELTKNFGLELWLAKHLGFITEQNGVYSMTLKGAFYYHYYENYYTLSYIDKMWGIMREEAFPEYILL